MEDSAEQFVGACETHSLDAMKSLLDGGLSAVEPIRGRTPVQWLLEMYYRSDAFPGCLRLLLDRGGKLVDPLIAPVLLNDAAAIRSNRALKTHRTTLKCAFTPLVEATMLHVAAEYGNADAVRALIGMGADLNSRAGFDSLGYDGQTPLFHTVNSNGNRSAPIMRMLLESGAKCDVHLPGLTWGRGFEWETMLFDVTPISYCQAGLLPQFHRKEADIYGNIKALLIAAGRAVPEMGNVPNKYLA